MKLSKFVSPHLPPAAICVCLLSTLYPAVAAPGDLDPSFGTGGVVVTGSEGGYENGGPVFIQADGKILVAGFPLPVRYEADGTVDATFAAVSPALEGLDDYLFYTPAGSALQSDGKLLVAGLLEDLLSDDDYSDGILTRYNTDGSLDAGFGVDGSVIGDFGIEDAFSAVAVQADGKIVAGGTIESDALIARYDADGNLDTTFGDGGATIDGFGGRRSIVISIAVDAAGRAVLGGISQTRSVFDFVLERFDEDGNPDASFGEDGKVVADLGGNSDRALDLKIQSGDGKILVAAGAANGNFALVRYNPDGTPDAGFGTTGVVATNLVATSGSTGVALQNDGRILATGRYLDKFLLARYDADGSPDLSFGSLGRQVTGIGGGASALSVAIQSDGRIVVAGSAFGGGRDIAVARYLADGPARPLATFTTLAATEISPTSATLNATVNAGGVTGGASAISFIFSADGGVNLSGINAAPRSVTGNGETAVRTTLSGLNPGTTYHFRVRGISGGVQQLGGELDFTTASPVPPQNSAPAPPAVSSVSPTRDAEDALIQWATGTASAGSEIPDCGLVRSGETLEFTYTASIAGLAGGASLSVEWSDDPAGPWSTAGVSETPLREDGTLRWMKAILPSGNAGRRFVHLKITGP